MVKTSQGHVHKLRKWEAEGQGDEGKENTVPDCNISLKWNKIEFVPSRIGTR